MKRLKTHDYEGQGHIKKTHRLQMSFIVILKSKEFIVLIRYFLSRIKCAIVRPSQYF